MGGVEGARNVPPRNSNSTDFESFICRRSRILEACNRDSSFDVFHAHLPQSQYSTYLKHMQER